MMTKNELAPKIVDRLLSDLNDRSGLGLDSVDKETREEIRRTWIEIVGEEMEKDVRLETAIATLRRLANEEHMADAARSLSRFGSAGAGMACDSTQKYAVETLKKMGVSLK